MLGSTLLGFCAILPGKKVAVGDTWHWKGNLLNIGGCDSLEAEFKLVAVVDHNGKKAAKITGTIPKGWPKTASDVKCELLYLIDTGVPVKASYTYKSKSRTVTLRTTARWLDARATATATAEAVASRPTSRRASGRKGTGPKATTGK